VLNPDFVEAVEGESPTVHFTTTSYPPLLEDAQHTLTEENGRVATERFRVEGSSITFSEVKPSDSGVYVIRCRNDAGLVGMETLELDITPANNSHGESCCFFFQMYMSD
jgi:hypothetical protein